MRYFSSPGSLRRPMYSGGDDPKGPGFPIRISADQSSFAAPHGFSQRTTSFIASRCQGIHQTPLRRLIDPTSNGQRPNGLTTIRRRPPDRDHVISIVLPSQHDRTIHRPGHTELPSRGIPLRTGARPVYALHHVQQHARPEGRATPRPALGRQGRTLVSSIEPALLAKRPVREWWAREDLNFRPHAYQARALTN